MSARIAVIGCGMVGALRAQAIAGMTGAELRVVCDIEKERATAMGARHRCAAENDWGMTVAREDIDIVVVSTPNDSHAEITLRAIEAGKHVLCEKPLGRTPEECRRMVVSARQRGVKLMTGFNHRRYPSIAKARALLEAGVIGRPLSFRGWIGHEGGPEFLKRWVGNAGVAGGGTLVDNGVHLIDLVRFLLGEVTHAQGLTRTSLWDISPSEDQAMALLRTQSGALAFVMSSWTEWRGYRLWFQIHGSQGSVTAQYPPMLTVLDVNADGAKRPKRTRFLFIRDQIMGRVRGYGWTTVHSFSEEVAELISAVREDRDPEPSGNDGLRAVEIAHSIYESSA